jgi:HNH endonuclease
MKLTIIQTLTPNDRYTDADTRRPGVEIRQMSVPIRVLPVPEPEPQPEPEPSPVVGDEHKQYVHYLRHVLSGPYGLSHKLSVVTSALHTDETTASSMIERGCDYVVKCYLDGKWAERRAAWEEKETRRNAACLEREKRRQASHRFWIFRNRMVEVDGWENASREEIAVQVKHKVLSEDKTFARMQREVELFEKLEHIPASCDRERIPDDVKIFVWRRDQGRCARCGSRKKIEFGHLIPLEQGGSNTPRNVEILCEVCNREKGAAA